MPAAKGSTPWNAGTGKGWTDQRGYRWLYVLEGGRRHARREHRVVMERSIGRALEPWEIVHHKDGNPANNDLSNLEIQEFGAHTSAHHGGGRKSRDAKRSMEAFGLMREALKREREIKADLLKALLKIQWAGTDTDPENFNGFICPACEEPESQGHLRGCLVGDAIAKAEGPDQQSAS